MLPGARAFYFFVFSLLAACSHAPPTGPAAPRGAVIAGDFPDPSVIRDGSVYWAVATTSAWAPAFSLLTSADFANWRVVGGVFPVPPAWTNGHYWAPEISKMNGRYFVYYAARSRRSGGMCVGVATATKPIGPYRDHGSLVCEAAGSIDPAPVVDERGDKFLFWKEDGNSQHRPTPIHVQRLSPDGIRLVGERAEAIRNDSAWEGALVEGPYVLRHGGYWYLFYSGSGCCGRDCDYAVGVARSPSLLGPWAKNPANPILKGNADWKCPGHGSIVQTPEGRDIFLYHAYQRRDSVYVGRQAMADLVEWGADAWPTINQGRGPSSHADGFLGAKVRNAESRYEDRFRGPSLAPGWQWPASQGACHAVGGKGEGRLILRAKGPEPSSAVLARASALGDYVATAEVDPPAVGAAAGLSAYGDAENNLGVTLGGGQFRAWKREKGKTVILGEWPAGGARYLQMSARAGHYFRFAVSSEGRRWEPLGGEMDGEYLPPWDLGIRIALTAGGAPGASVAFRSFRMEPAR